MGSERDAMDRGLPGGFGYAGDLSFVRKLTEADTANTEESEETMPTTAEATAVVDPRWESRLTPVCLGP